MAKTAVLPNLRHLRAFQAVARLQSLSRASVEINLSQPALSQVISNLDVNFGASLFERRRDGSYLTEFGVLLLARTKRMFAHIESTLEELLDERSNIPSLVDKITSTQIRSLIAVSENVSFDQAAKSLDLSQPSLQRAARDLEGVLGRQLYHRSARGTTTNKEGYEFARRIKLAIREIDYARDEIDVRKGVVGSLLTIGTLATSGSYLLSRAVNEFLKINPTVRVRIVEEPYEHLLNDLRSGNIDFLFGVLRKPDWATDVLEKELYSDPYFIAVRPGHPLTKKSKLNWRDLIEYDWIVPGPATPRHLAFKRLFPVKQKPPSNSIETTSRGVLRAILTMSDRVTLLTRHEAQFEQKLGVFSILPVPTKLSRRRYGISTRVDWQPTAMQQQFLITLAIANRELALD